MVASRAAKAAESQRVGEGREHTEERGGVEMGGEGDDISIREGEAVRDFGGDKVSRDFWGVESERDGEIGVGWRACGCMARSLFDKSGERGEEIEEGGAREPKVDGESSSSGEAGEKLEGEDSVDNASLCEKGERKSPFSTKAGEEGEKAASSPTERACEDEIVANSEELAEDVVEDMWAR